MKPTFDIVQYDADIPDGDGGDYDGGDSTVPILFADPFEDLPREAAPKRPQGQRRGQGQGRNNNRVEPEEPLALYGPPGLG